MEDVQNNDDSERIFWRYEKIAFLALSSIKGVGFWALHKVAKAGLAFNEYLRNPDTSLIDKMSKEFYPEGVDPALISIADMVKLIWDRGVDAARELANNNIVLVFKDESSFPARLREIPDAPYWIFIQGNPIALYSFSVAVVGTRKPSDDGAFLTKYAIASLAQTGAVTISGLASGVDQLAHAQSIHYRIKTVAVLGTGIYVDYPKGSEKVRSAIIEGGGCIVSEYLPYQSASAENFVRRNRIQAALCDTLIPIEWGVKSGTAHTVNYAHKYGRRIAGIYLPMTFDSRPELEFSRSAYGAAVFEVPFEVLDFLKFVFEVD